jgi:hypothetical protein
VTANQSFLSLLLIHVFKGVWRCSFRPNIAYFYCKCDEQYLAGANVERKPSNHMKDLAEPGAANIPKSKSESPLTSIDGHPMAFFDTIWTPHTVSLTGHRGKGVHHQYHLHHFHFPPGKITSFAQKLKEQALKLQHVAGGESCVSSWSPDTDIRQTKLAYHIEIEVPGTTDKESLLIQWMSLRTLIVKGTVERRRIGGGKMAEGDYIWEQEDEDWTHGVKERQRVRYLPLPIRIG